MNLTNKKVKGKAIRLIALDIIIGLLCVGVFYEVEYILPSKESDKYTIITPTNEVTQDDEQESEEDANTTTNDTTSSTNWSEKFADKFTDTIIQTDDSYSSPNVSISIEKKTVTVGSSQVNYTIADIYLADITCFQTALAQDTYGTGYKDSIANMAEENNAILATNGDYYSFSKEGVVIRNGVVYRTSVTDADVCVLYYDGTMKTFAGSEFDIDQAITDGAYQAWTFGPSLLDESGNSISEFDASKRLQGKNPRTAIGYYEPGHYCLVTIDGREEDSAGMTLSDMSTLFKELGCTVAYNLDGGKSSVMVYEGEIINSPVNGGRQSSDSILIKELTK